MAIFKKEITFDVFVRSLTAIVGVVLLVLAIDYLSPVLLPFVVAWFLAYQTFSRSCLYHRVIALDSSSISMQVKDQRRIGLYPFWKEDVKPAHITIDLQGILHEPLRIEKGELKIED